jgi:F-type H+-transporting ATPase subunit delta
LSVSAISRRYAKALVQLAAEQNQLEGFGTELERFSSLLAEQERLRLLLESPTFPMERKSAILADLLAKLQFSPTTEKFLGLLLEKDRLQYLQQINAEYRRQADELAGVVRARITAAAELDDAQCRAIVQSLKSQTGKEVELTVAVDPALIGGLQTEIGGRLFDGSLRTQLKRIEDTLTKG